MFEIKQKILPGERSKRAFIRRVFQASACSIHGAGGFILSPWSVGPNHCSLVCDAPGGPRLRVATELSL